MLELLAVEPHGLNLQDIARRLDRSPNELFHLLDVLVRRGFLARQPDATYLLTLRSFELGHLPPPEDRLLDCAMPHMQELARDTKLSVPAAREKLRQSARLISRSLGWVGARR